DDGVADIGIDLGEEVAADDHRLGLGVVDVGGDDGAAPRDLAAHEFRRDLAWDVRAEGLAVRQRAAPQILSRRDEAHFLGDDAGPRVVELRDVAALLGAQRLQPRAVELRDREQLAALEPVVLGLADAAFVFLDVAPRDDPIAAAGREPLADIDRGSFVRIRTGCVVEPDRRFAAGERHLAERHAVQVNLARAGQRAARDAQGFRIENGLVHRTSPYAGVSRIRFKGT